MSRRGEFRGFVLSEPGDMREREYRHAWPTDYSAHLAFSHLGKHRRRFALATRIHPAYDVRQRSAVGIRQQSVAGSRCHRDSRDIGPITRGVNKSAYHSRDVRVMLQRLQLHEPRSRTHQRVFSGSLCENRPRIVNRDAFDGARTQIQSDKHSHTHATPSLENLSPRDCRMGLMGRRLRRRRNP